MFGDCYGCVCAMEMRRLGLNIVQRYILRAKTSTLLVSAERPRCRDRHPKQSTTLELTDVCSQAESERPGEQSRINDAR